MLQTHPASPTQSAERAYVRAFFLSSFVDAADKFGEQGEVLLQRTGVLPGILDTPYEWLPLETYIAATEGAAELTGNTSIGIEAGRLFQLSDLGPFYALIMASPTLGIMLESYVKFQTYWQTCTSLKLEGDEDRTHVIYKIGKPDLWPRRQDAEFTIVALCSGIRQAMGARWRPLEVSFEHDISKHEDTLRNALNCPVFGNQAQNAISLLSTTLQAPLPLSARPDFERVQNTLERHLIDLMRSAKQTAPNIIDQIRQRIDLRSGSTSILIRDIASDLDLPERTLRRRLARHGISFRELLLEQRMTRACLLLKSRDDFPLDQLSDQLGYADTASFSRAFKNVIGVSPRRYARTHQNP